MGSRLQSTEEAKLTFERAIDALQEQLQEHRDSLFRELEAHRSGQLEHLRESLTAEREETARGHSGLRETLLETERALLEQLRATERQLPQRIADGLADCGHLTRADLEPEFQRLWQALDTHTHAFQEGRSPLPDPASLVQTRPAVVVSAPRPSMAAPSALAEPPASCSVTLPMAMAGTGSPVAGRGSLRLPMASPMAGAASPVVGRGSLSLRVAGPHTPAATPRAAVSAVLASGAGSGRHTPVATPRAAGALPVGVPISAGSSVSASAGRMPLLGGSAPLLVPRGSSWS